MLWLLRLITGHEAWNWFEQSESFTQIQFQAEALIGFHPLDLTLAFQNDNPCKTHLRVRFTSILHKNAFEASPAQAAHAKILFLYYSTVSTYLCIVLVWKRFSGCFEEICFASSPQVGRLVHTQAGLGHPHTIFHVSGPPNNILCFPYL